MRSDAMFATPASPTNMEERAAVRSELNSTPLNKLHEILAAIRLRNAAPNTEVDNAEDDEPKDHTTKVTQLQEPVPIYLV